MFPRELNEGATIQVLVNSDADQAGLQQILGDTYDLTFEDTLQPVDCYILTSRVLPKYVTPLEKEKERQAPTFSPVLLIQQADTRIDDEFLLSDKGTAVIDDLIDAPIEPSMLHRRVENLITRRSQSIALTRQFERAESWFHGVFDAIPDPAFVVDTDCAIQEVNDAFCAFVGVHHTEVLGQNLTDLPVTISAFEELEEAIRVRENGPVSVENRPFACNEATEMDYALLSIQTAEVEDTTYVIGILSDVTELHKKTERLEKLASVLSHDLRNPVQVAELHLMTLREAHPDSTEQIEAVQRAVDRIGELTEELVTIARTGEDMEFEELRLHECANVAWEHVAIDAGTLLIEQREKTFHGDPSRVLQLFENLFRNAFEHGGEDVTVWVGETETGFYVEDDGPGIPPDKRDEVFRLGYSTNPNGNGLGLGIVNEIVEAHDWEIRIEEGRKGGTKFQIYCVEMSG